MRVDAKWTNTIIGIVVVAILAIIFPLILDGSDGILREDQSDTAVGVVNTGGSGTMTLTMPLYDADVSYVTTMTSNVGSDTAVASTYSSTTGVLTMTGLVGTPMAVGTRQVTCAYQYDQTDDYTGLQEIVEVAPMILWIGIIIGFGVIAVSGYRAARKS